MGLFNKEYQKPSIADQSQVIYFFVVNKFSMMAYVSAIESLRNANRLSEKELYRWVVLTVDGQPVTASNDMPLEAHDSIYNTKKIPNLIICTSFDPEESYCEKLAYKLRQLSRAGTEFGAMDTGCALLAAAGLLDGYKVAVHWEYAATFSEKYPAIDISSEIFEVDRDRFTCAGALSSMELMLHMIRIRQGNELAAAISNMLIHESMRKNQQSFSRHLMMTHSGLNKVIAVMKETLDNPISLEELAAIGNMSARQLQRLFKQEFQQSPNRYYLQLRLERARQLLQYTDMYIADAAAATGFGCLTYFSRAYRKRFARLPSQDRKQMLGMLQ